MANANDIYKQVSAGRASSQQQSSGTSSGSAVKASPSANSGTKSVSQSIYDQVSAGRQQQRQQQPVTTSWVKQDFTNKYNGYINSGKSDYNVSKGFYSRASKYAADAKTEEDKKYWSDIANKAKGLYEYDFYSSNRSQYEAAGKELEELTASKQTAQNNLKGYQQAVYTGSQTADILTKYDQALKDNANYDKRIKELTALQAQLDDEIFDALASDEEKAARERLKSGESSKLAKANIRPIGPDGKPIQLPTEVQGFVNQANQQAISDQEIVDNFMRSVGSNVRYYNAVDRGVAAAESAGQEIVSSGISFASTVGKALDSYEGSDINVETRGASVNGNYKTKAEREADKQRVGLPENQATEDYLAWYNAESAKFNDANYAFDNSRDAFEEENRQRLEALIKPEIEAYDKRISYLETRIANQQKSGTFMDSEALRIAQEDSAKLKELKKQREDMESRLLDAQGLRDKTSFRYKLATDYQNDVFAKMDSVVDTLDAKSQAEILKAKEGASKLGGVLLDMEKTGIEMGFDMVAGMATGGSSLVPMFVRVMGNEAAAARRDGATLDQQLKYAVTKAGIEVATEKLFGAFDKIGYGKGIANEMSERIVAKLAETDIGRTVVRALIAAAEEGAEEGLADILAPIADQMYKDETWKESWDNNTANFWYDVLLGAAMGGLGFAGGVVSGQNTQANQELRRNEASQSIQNVVDYETALEQYNDKVDSRTRELVKYEGMTEAAAKAQAVEEIGEAPQEPTLSAGATAQQKLTALKMMEQLAGENANLEEVGNDLKLTQQEFDSALQQGLVEKADAAKYLATEEAGEAEEAPAATGEGVQSRLSAKDNKTRKVDENGNPLNRMRKLTERMARIAERLGYGNKTNQSDAYKTATGMTPEEVDAQNNAASAEAMQEAGAQPKGGDASPYNLDNYDQTGINKLWKDRKMTSGQYAEAMVQKGFWSEATARNFLSLVKSEGSKLGLNTAEERKRNLGNYTIGQNNAQNAPQGQAASGGAPVATEGAEEVKPAVKLAEWDKISSDTIASIDSSIRDGVPFIYDGLEEDGKPVHAIYNPADNTMTIFADDGSKAKTIYKNATPDEFKQYINEHVKGARSNNERADQDGTDSLPGLQEGSETETNEERNRLDAKLFSRAPKAIKNAGREERRKWLIEARHIEKNGGRILSEDEYSPAIKKAVDSYTRLFGRPVTFYDNSNAKLSIGYRIRDEKIGNFIGINHPQVNHPGTTLFHENGHEQWELNGTNVSRRDTVLGALVEAGATTEDVNNFLSEVLDNYGYKYIDGAGVRLVGVKFKFFEPDGKTEIKNGEQWGKLSYIDQLLTLQALSPDIKNQAVEDLYEEFSNWLMTDDKGWIGDYSSFATAPQAMRKALVNAGIYTQEEMDEMSSIASDLDSEFGVSNKAAATPQSLPVKPVDRFDGHVGTALYELENPSNKNDKTLIAVRNMSLRHLLTVLKAGGEAMPSIAIMKPSHGHEKYGEVSVIYYRETIDPSADKRNRVYGADGWTPTHPPVRSEKSFKKALKAYGFEDAANDLGVTAYYPEDFSDYYSGAQMMRQLAEYPAIKAKVAKELGLTREEFQNMSEYGRLMHEALEAIGEAIETDDGGLGIRLTMPSGQELEIKTQDGIEEWDDDAQDMIIGDYAPNEFAGEDALSLIKKYSLLDEFVEAVSEYFDYDGMANPFHEVDNRANLSAKEKQAVKEHIISTGIQFFADASGYKNVDDLVIDKLISDEEALNWLMEHPFDPSLVEDVKYIYDEYGNQVPYSLEAVLENMLNQPDRKPINHDHGSDLRSMVTHSFKSFDELKSHESKLASKRDHGKYQDQYDAADAAVERAEIAIAKSANVTPYGARNIIRRIARTYEESVDAHKTYTHGNLIVDDDTGAVITEYTEDNPTGDILTFTLNNTFSTYNLDENAKSAIKEAFNLLADLPTGFFESKAQRIVPNREWGAVLLPDLGAVMREGEYSNRESAEADLEEARNALDSAGIKYIEYGNGPEYNNLDPFGPHYQDGVPVKEGLPTRGTVMKTKLAQYMFEQPRKSPVAPGTIKESDSEALRKQTARGEEKAVRDSGGTTFVSKTNADRSFVADKAIGENDENLSAVIDSLLSKDERWDDQDVVTAERAMYKMIRAIRDYQLGNSRKMKKSAFDALISRYNQLATRHINEKSKAGQKLQATYQFTPEELVMNRMAKTFLGFAKDGTFAGNTNLAVNAKIYAAAEDAANRITEAAEAKDAKALAQICKDISDIRGVKNMFGAASGFASKVEDEILNAIAQQENGVEALQTLALGNLNAICDDVQPYKVVNAAKTIRVMNMLSNMSTIINNITNNIASGLTSTNAVSQGASLLASKAFENITGQTVLTPAAKGWVANKEIRNAEMEALKMATLVQLYGVNQENGKLEIQGDKGLFNPNANAFEQTMAMYKFFIGMGVEATDQVKSEGLMKAMNVGIDKALAKGKITEKQAEAMRQEAEHEVRRLLYKDDNRLSGFVQGVRNKLNKVKSWGNDDIGTIGLGDIAMAFAKVPANVVRARLYATPEGCLVQLAQYTKGVMKAKRMHSETMARQIMEDHAPELKKLRAELQDAYDLEAKEVSRETKDAKIAEIKSKIAALNRECWNEAREKCSGGVYNKLVKMRDNYGSNLDFDDCVQRCKYSDATEMSQFEAATYSRKIGKAATSAGMVALGAILRGLGALRDFDQEPDDELRKMYKQKGYSGLMFNWSAIGRKDHEWRDGDIILDADFLEVVAMPLAIGACAKECAMNVEGKGKTKAFVTEAAASGLSKTFEAVGDIPGMADAVNLYNAITSQFNTDNAAKGSRVFNAGVQYLANTLPSFFIPNAYTQLGAGLDNTVRDTYTTDNIWQQAGNIMLNKTAFLRKKIPASVDMWGEERHYGEDKFWGVVNKTLLPGDRIRYRQNKYESEIIRLTKEGYKGATPKLSVSGSFEVDGEIYEMDADEKRAYRQNRNTEQAEVYREFMDSPEYNMLTDDQKVAVLKDLKMDCERDAKQAMLNDRGLDTEVTRAKWETELTTTKQQITYLSMKQIAGAAWDSDENRVSDFAAMDKFLKDNYSKMTQPMRDILDGSMSQLDKMYDASKVGIGSEMWQKAYDIYRQYNSEEGQNAVDGGFKDWEAAEMWTKIEKATGANSTQMGWFEENMTLMRHMRVNPEHYQDLTDKLGWSRESSTYLTKAMSELQPSNGNKTVSYKQRLRCIAETPDVTDDQKWEAFYEYCPSSYTKIIKGMTNLRNRGYTYEQALKTYKSGKNSMWWVYEGE